MYKLSIAQIQFLSLDNTHTKYLRGGDKNAWNGFKEAYEAQLKLDNFMKGLHIPENLGEGEEIDIPVNRNRRNNANPKKKK